MESRTEAQEVLDRLYELLKQGKFSEAQGEPMAGSIVSTLIHQGFPGQVPVYTCKECGAAEGWSGIISRQGESHC